MKKKSTGNFDKFTKRKSNAAIKEQFKQEKRKLKKEREEFFDNKRKEKAESFRQNAQGSMHNAKSGMHNAKGKMQKAEGRMPNAERNGSFKPVTGNQQPATSNKQQVTISQMPLNKFIAHSGVCARREAAEIVKEGKVKVNNAVVTEPGFKVSAKDIVIVNGKRIHLSKNLVYILLNKPKDYITTTDDPQKRKTVLDLFKNTIKERIYPVGRLDRNTSGVLILTNDGDLSQKLTHPSNEIKKVYAVTLNKPLEKNHFDQILKGVVLEDGPASVDVLAYADVKDKTQIGVEIHSGRNRIVRRIFEHLGYDVKNLDRVVFAGLTKKNVDRGKWRFLTEKEIRDLKYFKKGK